MTTKEIYRTLSHSGPYSLPYLVRMYHQDYGELLLVNSPVDIEYKGKTYLAANFEYTRPKTIGGVLDGGSLSVSVIGNTATDLFMLADYLMTVTVVGVLMQGGEVQPVQQYRHQYGTVTVDSSMKMQLSFTNDDRLGMVFPPYVFDNDNNRGNA